MMRNSVSNIFTNLDWLLILLYLLLVSIGWMSIFAVDFSSEAAGLINLSTHYGKQLVWIGFSVVLVSLILSIEAAFYEKYASVFYIISLFFLLGLFVFGKTINGQTAWYSFGGFSLQPSEFVKITTALAVAKIMSDNQFDIKKFSDFKNVLIVLFIPFTLIILQPDFGSAIVYFAFVFVLLRQGMSLQLFGSLFAITIVFISTIKFGTYFTLAVVLILLVLFFYYAYKRQKMFFRRNLPFVIGSIVGALLLTFGSSLFYNKALQPHHKDRIALWLRMEKDQKKIKALKRTYGFNNDQAVKTIASGGLIGKGFLEGDRTNGKFVPEQHTDYIFSAIGEEFGFLGSALVIILFLSLILRILYKAEIQKSRFSRIYAYGLASILFVHFTINIGMVLDLLPTVGIPLPFFSYGGSSLWSFTILLFIFIKLDAIQSDVF